jgi:tRNA(Arg) A34 adenosine deaminase TadA
MADFDEAFRAATGSAPPEVANPRLRELWNHPVSELATLHEPPLPAAQQERHRIYSLMLMAILHEYYNGNKNGREGEYPWNETGDVGRHGDGDYLGHNIAGIAVNGKGEVIDFDFNHNKLFNSSAEHAEVRLVRRVFALAQLSDSWRPVEPGEAPPDQVPLSTSTTLADVTVYTTLESCAQCSGTMALGAVREVVYLQTDPGTYWVGRVLRNLTNDQAPLPISGGEISLPHFAQLDAGFSAFRKKVGDPPFWRLGHREDSSKAVTSYLCTKHARDIYGAARAEFEALAKDPGTLAYPDHKPRPPKGATQDEVLSNAAAVAEASTFLDYAIASGRRGTPHR